MRQRIAHTCAPVAVILSRLLATAAFLSEGLQKFLFPDQLGGGILKIGLPMAEGLGPFVATFEYV